MKKILVYMDTDKTWAWKYYENGKILARSDDPIASEKVATAAAKKVFKDVEVTVAKP